MTFKLRLLYLWQTNFASYEESTQLSRTQLIFSCIFGELPSKGINQPWKLDEQGLTKYQVVQRPPLTLSPHLPRQLVLFISCGEEWLLVCKRRLRWLVSANASEWLSSHSEALAETSHRRRWRLHIQLLDCAWPYSYVYRRRTCDNDSTVKPPSAACYGHVALAFRSITVTTELSGRPALPGMASWADGERFPLLPAVLSDVVLDRQPRDVWLDELGTNIWPW